MLLNKVLQEIVSTGGKPYFVGGYVRDQILGRQSKDVDVEVFGMSLDALQNVLERFGSVDVVGRQFGVLKIHELADVDFSIPRKDNRIGTGHKDFKVDVWEGATLEQAASRRDLTMNAMLMDPFTKEISDPFGGQKDIADGWMRATDNKTFVEDNLRALRVMQFVARFPAIKPDPNLIALCSAMDLSTLPGERIYEEFVKMFLKGSRPDKGLQFLKEANLLRYFPEIQSLVGCQQEFEWHQEGDVWNHTVMVVGQATIHRMPDLNEQSLILMFAALCHDFGKATTTRFERGRWRAHGHESTGVAPARKFLERLVAPLWLIEPVCILVQHHMEPFDFIKQGASPSAYRRLARKLKGVSFEMLAKIALSDGNGRITTDPTAQQDKDIEEFLRRAAAAGINNYVQTPSTDVVLGRHLLSRGFKPGVEIGKILKQCREVQDEQGLTDADKILDIVLEKK